MRGKHVFAVAVGLFALGIIVEIFVPASARFIDISAIAFAAATWIIPPLRFAFGGNNLRGSLARVGFFIHVIVLAATFSVLGLMAALLTLMFASNGEWTWRAFIAIAVFWVVAFLALAVGKRFEPPKANPPPS
jgi:hypothetical protein